MNLTARQERVLRILCDSDVPPSYQELAAAIPNVDPDNLLATLAHYRSAS